MQVKINPQNSETKNTYIHKPLQRIEISVLSLGTEKYWLFARAFRMNLMSTCLKFLASSSSAMSALFLWNYNDFLKKVLREKSSTT